MLRALTPLASTVDSFVARFVTGRSPSSRARSASESLGHAARIAALEDIAKTYAAAEDEKFFASAEKVHFRSFDVGTRKGARVRDVRFTSRVETFASALSEKFERVIENREGAARLYEHDASGLPARPAIVLVHGYRSGQFAIEEIAWPIDWMLSRGLDVALFVLPFHGVRAQPGRGPMFPASDPRFTIEGFRQAIGDLRALITHLRARGAPHVGMMGMSLGGYTTALYASLDASLAFAVPMIPLASFADVARDAGRLVGNQEEQELQRAALERAFSIASPLARKLAIPKTRALVLAAEGDRITPLSHARKIADHWDTPLVTFPGGHIVQLGRRDAFRAVMTMLRREGIVAH
jgi:pimeloyl-ACP methyl ester carboxylesterase